MHPAVDVFSRFRGMSRVRALEQKNAIFADDVKNCAIEPRAIRRTNLSARKFNIRTWFAPLLLSSLVVILYGPILESLARQWREDPNYGHGFFVPLFAGFVLWRERDRWLAAPARANRLGLVIMLFAIMLLVLGTLAAELFTVSTPLSVSPLKLTVLLAACV